MIKDRDPSNFSYEPVLLEKVLRRISIPRGQVTLLNALYEAEGKFVSREKLIEQIRWGDPKSFTGVLAAFAGRINQIGDLRKRNQVMRRLFERLYRLHKNPDERGCKTWYRSLE